jgi:hypothetical protein
MTGVFVLHASAQTATNTFPNNGNVGIGTTSPASPLHIESNQSYNGEVGQLRLSPTTNPGKRLYMGFDDAADFGYVQTVHSGVAYKNLILQPSAGYVGIGTTSPNYRLHVAGDLGIGVQSATNGSLVFFNATNSSYGVIQQTSSALNFYQTYSTTGGYVPMTFATGGSERIRIATDGKVGIGTSGPSEKLEVSGNLKVSANGSLPGNITAAGTIEADNIKAKYQDVAEWVPSSEQLSAGTVVVLDSTKSNQVTSSSVSYDTRVAGVISEQPGIALGEKSDGKVLVATTGRVRVKVDATKSPIHIGDLLVTSDVPGVAMKSEAVNLGGVQFHRPGTLIGKALEPLEKGKGEVLVLLSLQ